MKHEFIFIGITTILKAAKNIKIHLTKEKKKYFQTHNTIYAHCDFIFLGTFYNFQLFAIDETNQVVSLNKHQTPLLINTSSQNYSTPS